MRRGSRKIIALVVAIALVGGSVALWKSGWWVVIRARVVGKKTIEDRLNEFGDAARNRLRPKFASAGVSYPPSRVILLGLKSERRLEVFADDSSGMKKHITSFPIIAASGDVGPKLREGDRQAPEGFYAIESLNPNSRFHAALRVNYPNAFDKEMAAKDGRKNLGGDIMIHGSSASVGCLAMGDPVAEELFTLAADTGIEKVELILSPRDFRSGMPPTQPADPAWLGDLYAKITIAMRDLPQ